MTAIAATELIAELDNVVEACSPERRVQILRQVAGLFLSDADRLKEHHIGVFDEVLVRLMKCVDPRALVRLSISFADLRPAPRDAIRYLAHHEDAAIAAPILLKSEALSDSDLVEIAHDCGQQHLLAIAGRKLPGPSLTDILLERGDTNVCRELAGNPGARFSSSGFTMLIEVAGRDDDTADSLVRRSDTPPEVVGRLVSKSTPAVHSRLLRRVPPEMRETILAAIDSSVDQTRTPRGAPVDYSEAHSTVLAFSKAGKLNDSSVNRFAIRREHRNVIAALALLASIPTDTVESLMEDGDCCGLAIACRASRLNWQTTMAIISNRNDVPPIPAWELVQVKDVFDMLSLSTAQRTIRFGSVEELLVRPHAPAGAA
ncbi:DUF2336 domain-containing protein [Bradyrhizobium sp. LjRoot220]|uniref:DUF2336 domain-containing protein n=1 Tax=Bradyrhizobium sp. LjRoot220 TaxID=3342284 RepID=UPI003ECF60C0